MSVLSVLLSCLSNIICTTCDCLFIRNVDLTPLDLIQGGNHFPLFIQISVGCGGFKNVYHWNKKGKWLVPRMTELNTFNTKDTFYIKCLLCIQNVIKSIPTRPRQCRCLRPLHRCSHHRFPRLPLPPLVQIALGELGLHSPC